MPHLAACPDPARYAQALAGRLSAGELDELASHLEACPGCLEVARSLPDDPLSGLLRRGGAGDSDLPAAVPGLVERVLRLSRPGGATTTSQGDSEARTGDQPDSAAGPAPNLAFLGPARQADEIGRLGPYRVLALLGEGGMGLVFRAEDPRLRRQVALKVMKPERASRPQARERFLREARAMAALDHERIVPVYHAD